MASIGFYSHDNGTINVAGSGLGFYGATFGTSVSVGAYQDSTYITDSTGTVNAAQVHNMKYTHPSSGSINGLTSVNVLNFPNQLATLNIRFTHGSAVKTQNAVFRVYDRNNINNNPSGVTAKVVEIVHPSTVQSGLLGSGGSTWSTLFGSGSTLSLISSPGMSGLRPSGSNTTQTRHDWYLAISVSPDSIGSKTFAGYFSCEYL